MILLVNNGTIHLQELKRFLGKKRIRYKIATPRSRLKTLMKDRYKGVILTGGNLLYDGKIDIEEITIDETRPVKRYTEGVNPISNGIVIDHICRGDDRREIREHTARIIKVMELYGKGGEWISSSREKEGSMKGIIFRPERKELSTSEIKKLAAIAPGATLNIIRNSRVVRKLQLHMPPKVYKLDSVSCKNPDCISHPSHSENVPPEFIRTSGNNLSCIYCEKEHSFKEIWK